MAVPEVDEVERAPDGSSAKQAAMGAATSSVAPSALQLDRLVVASRSTPSDQLEPLLTVTHPPGQPEPLIQSSKLPVRWQADPASPATRSSALLSIPRSLGQLVEVQLNLSSRDSADIYLAYATNDAELERLTTYPSAVSSAASCPLARPELNALCPGQHVANSSTGAGIVTAAIRLSAAALPSLADISSGRQAALCPCRPKARLASGELCPLAGRRNTLFVLSRHALSFHAPQPLSASHS